MEAKMMYIMSSRSTRVTQYPVLKPNIEDRIRERKKSRAMAHCVKVKVLTAKPDNRIITLIHNISASLAFCFTLDEGLFFYFFEIGSDVAQADLDSLYTKDDIDLLIFLTITRGLGCFQARTTNAWLI